MSNDEGKAAGDWKFRAAYWVFALDQLPFSCLFPQDFLDTTAARITFHITMRTVTLKVSDALEARIRRAMARRKETFSELARRALTREIEEGEVDFARLAEPYRGILEGARDLSVREGYGNRDDR